MTGFETTHAVSAERNVISLSVRDRPASATPERPSAGRAQPFITVYIRQQQQQQHQQPTLLSQVMLLRRLADSSGGRRRSILTDSLA